MTRGKARRCGFPAKRTGGPCKNRAGQRTDHEGYGHCWLHLGNSPTGRKAATRQAAEEAVVTYGLPREIDPVDALLEEIHRTAGHVDYIRAQIEALDPEALVWGISKREDVGASEFTGVNVTEAAAVNVWLDLYQRERKHLVDVCKTAIGAGIEERRVRLAEAQGKLAGEVLRKVLDGLNLSAEQQQLVPVLVRQNMALLRAPEPSVN